MAEQDPVQWDLNYGPWNSRKLWVSMISIVLTIGLPVLYKHLGISEQITLIVLGSVASVVSVYNITNVVQKKYENTPPGQ